ncbi:MAG: hypothetical protein LBR16_07740 [Treponema sp.]|jgi:FimV-like protein|nr:hypothetical protein [Treponema sp.]
MSVRKGVFVVLVFAQTAAGLFAQEDYKAKYLELLNSKQFDQLSEWLAEWEAAEPENPEMFIGYFNYFCQRNMQTAAAMGRMPNGQYGLYNQLRFRDDDVYEGISYLDKGLGSTPNRLDMYWGKIEILLKIEDYKTAGDTFHDLLAVSPQYNTRWLLGGNKPVPAKEGEEYFIGYADRYYDAFIAAMDRSEDAANALIQCAQKQIEVYPKSNHAHNYLAIYYMDHGKQSESLALLLAAEKIDPKDYIIAGSLAQLYAEMGEKKKAKTYFNKVLKAGNSQSKEWARNMIKEYGL